MNKRTQNRRMPLDWLVVRRAGTQEQFGLVMNLTICGMHLRTKVPCQQGAMLDLVLVLPEGFAEVEEVPVQAECRWSREADDGYHDVGMDITDGISQKGLEAVTALFFKYSA